MKKINKKYLEEYNLLLFLEKLIIVVRICYNLVKVKLLSCKHLVSYITLFCISNSLE